MEYEIVWCEWTGGRQNKQKWRKKGKSRKIIPNVIKEPILHDYVCK